MTPSSVDWIFCIVYWRKTSRYEQYDISLIQVHSETKYKQPLSIKMAPQVNLTWGHAKLYYHILRFLSGNQQVQTYDVIGNNQYHMPNRVSGYKGVYKCDDRIIGSNCSIHIVIAVPQHNGTSLSQLLQLWECQLHCLQQYLLWCQQNWGILMS